MNEKNTPKLRFPGFTDAWEQRKLLDCLTQPISDGPHETPDLVDEGIPFISVDAIVDNRIDFERKRGYITEEYDLECRKKYSPQRDDVFLVKSGSTVGKVAIVETDERFNIWSPLAAMRANKEVLVPKYLYYFLQLDDIQDELSAKSKGGTQPNLSMRILEKFMVRLPDVDEQNKISDALNVLDNLITLHQRKLDSIKQYKNGMLQKMFPNEGENVPEIRFPGFTDAWKRRVLGDLYAERNEKGNDTLQMLSVSIHTGVSDMALDEESLGKHVKRSEDKSKYKHVYSGDLIFNMMRAWQGAIGVAKNEGMISPAYISAIPNHEVFPLFMDYALRRDSAISEINHLSYGVTDFRKRLYWDSFIKVGCMIPSVDEQKTIYDYFKSLDHLITLQQHKLDRMKQYKKGLLQQMFV